MSVSWSLENIYYDIKYILLYEIFKLNFPSLKRSFIETFIYLLFEWRSFGNLDHKASESFWYAVVSDIKLSSMLAVNSVKTFIINFML